MFNLDTGQALADLKALEQGYKTVYDHQNDLVADTVAYTVDQIKARVQLFGQDADGNDLVSPSAERLGHYAYSYGLERQTRGLQTNYVDLTVTGELMNDFQAIPDGADAWAGGFRAGTMAQRADELEGHFSADIFTPSDSEIEDSTEYYSHNFNQLIDRL